jgi:uncharacterized protein with HEPN domain
MPRADQRGGQTLGPHGPKLLPDQPWHEIRALGNRLRHEYDRVRTDRIWNIVTNDLPVLRKACESALAQLSEP